jgi:RNA polymerase sigma-70 factor (ECF subfamily)
MTKADLILCEMLVLRFQRNDHSAANELVALFEKPLLYYLRRLVGSEDDAWDLFQETWISTFRTLHSLRDPRALPAFLYKTGRNRAMLFLRRRNADLRLYLTAETLHACDEREPNFTSEDAAAVHAGIDKLALPHREALTLYFLQDLTIDEIAMVLGIPPGTVKSRLHYAKQALSEFLDKEFNHGESE